MTDKTTTGEPMPDYSNYKRPRGRPPKSPEEKAETKRLAAQRKAMRAKSDLPSAFGQENMEPGDNSRFLKHALAIRAMPPVDLNNLPEVVERIDWYFSLCVSNDMKPAVKGLCNSLKISKDTIWKWKNGMVRTGSYQEVILQAYDLLEEMWENYMQNGKINPVAGIFLGKNNFGYQDKQEMVLTPNAQQPVDATTIAQKYAELPDPEED